MTTLKKFLEHREAIAAKWGESTTLAYADVSHAQLSIARYCGGCKVQGKHFVYNPTDDSLIREDVVKWIAKQEKKAE